MSINRFSKVFVPSDYVAPFDLNTYGYIGQQKDQQFEQHLQLLQSGFDQLVAQTDLIRPQDRDAFNSKMTSIVQQVNQHGNEDLGDPSVLSNVQGMGRQVYGDQNIIKAIGETQAVRKQQAQMDADQKKGKLAPQNADAFNDSLAEWMDPNDKTVGKSFSGSYIPHYEFAKKTLDVMAKAKADGYISYKDASGGLQTEVIKTKDLSENKLYEIARRVVESDPQAMVQKRIDSDYLAKRMRPEDVTASYQQMSKEMVGNYQNQIIELTMLKEDAVKEGNKKLEDHYTEGITKATEEMNKYAGYADPTNTASTLDMISKDKNFYYSQVFDDNFYKGAASVFTYKDKSVSVRNNLDKVMAMQNYYAEKLAKYKADLKGTKPLSSDNVILTPANSANNAMIESEMKATIQQRTESLSLEKGRLRNLITQANPTTSGTRYSGADGDKNYETDYTYWETMYNERQYDKLGGPNSDIVRHFEQISYDTNELSRMKEEMNEITKAYQADPNYKVASAAINKKMSEIAPRIDVKSRNGVTQFSLNKDEFMETADMLIKQDFDTVKDQLTDSKGNVHNFEYKIVKGNSPLAQRYNAQRRKNVEEAKARARNVKWTEAEFGTIFGIGIPGEMDRWLRQQGVLDDEYVPMNVKQGLGQALGGFIGKSFVDKYAVEDLVGSWMDGLFRTGEYVGGFYKQGTINHDNIDVPHTRNGFYNTVRTTGQQLNAIKDDYYTRFGFATMKAEEIVDGDDKTQDRIRPIVQRLVEVYGTEGKSEGVTKVISRTRNTSTGGMEWTYTTGKSEGVQYTVHVPPGAGGSTEAYFPVNQMQAIEDSLKRRSSGKEQTYPGQKMADVATSSDVREAFTIPHTTTKVRFFYHPYEHEFGYAPYLKSGVWDTEIRVKSLVDAITAVQSLQRSKDAEEERRRREVKEPESQTAE
jgi:hypothetical protein